MDSTPRLQFILVKSTGKDCRHGCISRRIRWTCSRNPDHPDNRTPSDTRGVVTGCNPRFSSPTGWSGLGWSVWKK